VIRLKKLVFRSVVIMDNNIEVEHEEELDFQLEINEDVGSEDDNMPSD
jgi:hypothetical protein